MIRGLYCVEGPVYPTPVASRINGFLMDLASSLNIKQDLLSGRQRARKAVVEGREGEREKGERVVQWDVVGPPGQNEYIFFSCSVWVIFKCGNSAVRLHNVILESNIISGLSINIVIYEFHSSCVKIRTTYVFSSLSRSIREGRMVPEGLSLPPRSLESLLVDRSKSEHDKIPTSEFGKQFHDVYGKWSTSGLSLSVECLFRGWFGSLFRAFILQLRWML